jgi:hypothetical protein
MPPPLDQFTIKQSPTLSFQSRKPEGYESKGVPTTPITRATTSRTALPYTRSKSVTLPNRDLYNALSPSAAHRRSGSGDYDTRSGTITSSPSTLQATSPFHNSPTSGTPATFSSLQMLQVPISSPATPLSFSQNRSSWFPSDSGVYPMSQISSQHDIAWDILGVPAPAPLSAASSQSVWSISAASANSQFTDMLVGIYTEPIPNVNGGDILMQPFCSNPPIAVHDTKVDHMYQLVTSPVIMHGTPMLQFTDSMLTNSPASQASFLEHSLHSGAGIPIISHEQQSFPLAIYIESYFQHFHQSHPVVHKPSYAAGINQHLDWAMASIGCQYQASPSARSDAVTLHDMAKTEIGIVSTSPGSD